MLERKMQEISLYSVDSRTKAKIFTYSIIRFFIPANQSIILFIYFSCKHAHNNHQQNLKKLNSLSGHNEKICIFTK